MSLYKGNVEIAKTEYIKTPLKLVTAKLVENENGYTLEITDKEDGEIVLSNIVIDDKQKIYLTNV